MSRLSLPVAGNQDPLLYTGNIEEDIRRLNGKTANELSGGLSYPSKMDVPAWGISATRCRIGSLLAEQPNSTCASCYARKGTFRFKNVEAKMERSYQALMDPRNLWTPAMAAMIRWYAQERFRWFVSGDLQGVNHLQNIIQVCLATPQVRHWLPSRESAVLQACKDEIPPNLTPRLSATMIDGPPPKSWPWTSTVVTEATDDVCPSSVKGGNCSEHDCTRCWTQEGDVPYLKH